MLALVLWIAADCKDMVVFAMVRFRLDAALCVLVGVTKKIEREDQEKSSRVVSALHSTPMSAPPRELGHTGNWEEAQRFAAFILSEIT